MTAGFAELHRAGDPLVLPNAWDVASARQLVRAGFAALGTTSLGVAAANGLPDGAGATEAETLLLTRRFVELPVHVSVDLGTGSVGAAGAVAAAGAAGVNLEDGLGPAGAHAEPVRGADGVFVPGLAEPGDVEAVVAAVEVPVNVLSLAGRHTVRSLADLPSYAELSG